MERRFNLPTTFAAPNCAVILPKEVELLDTVNHKLIWCDHKDMIGGEWNLYFVAGIDDDFNGEKLDYFTQKYLFSIYVKAESEDWKQDLLDWLFETSPASLRDTWLARWKDAMYLDYIGKYWEDNYWLEECERLYQEYVSKHGSPWHFTKCLDDYGRHVIFNIIEGRAVAKFKTRGGDQNIKVWLETLV